MVNRLGSLYFANLISKYTFWVIFGRVLEGSMEDASRAAAAVVESSSANAGAMNGGRVAVVEIIPAAMD